MNVRVWCKSEPRAMCVEPLGRQEAGSMVAVARVLLHHSRGRVPQLPSWTCHATGGDSGAIRR